MKEYEKLDEIFFKICVPISKDEFTPTQYQQIKEGIIYSHHGIIQFKLGEQIYATADNHIVRQYLQYKNFNINNSDNIPIVDFNSPGYMDKKFDELHSKFYGNNPSEEWGKTDPIKESKLMQEYRKYSALCFDRKLHRPPFINTSINQTLSRPYTNLKFFIQELEESDPYFMKSMDAFKDTLVGEAFNDMLRNKKLKGKEVLVSNSVETNLYDSENPGKLLYSWVAAFLDKTQAKLLKDQLDTSSGFLSKETMNYFKHKIIQERARHFLNEQEKRESR